MRNLSPSPCVNGIWRKGIWAAIRLSEVGGWAGGWASMVLLQLSKERRAEIGGLVGLAMGYPVIPC